LHIEQYALAITFHEQDARASLSRAGRTEGVPLTMLGGGDASYRMRKAERAFDQGLFVSQIENSGKTVVTSRHETQSASIEGTAVDGTSGGRYDPA